MPRTAWLTGTKFSFSSVLFNSFLLLFHAVPFHLYPKTLRPPHILFLLCLSAVTPLCYCFTLRKSPFTRFNSPRNGSFSVFYPKCPIHFFFQGFACEVLPAKCFFVTSPGQISALPPQICRRTKPSLVWPISGQSSPPRWRAIHAARLSPRAYERRSADRNRWWSTVSLLSICHLALNSSDPCVCVCVLHRKTVDEIMKCHSFYVVCHSLWWSSNREPATQAHLILLACLVSLSLLLYLLSHSYMPMPLFGSCPYFPFPCERRRNKEM